MSSQKLRVIKDYKKISIELKQQIKEAYPDGFNAYLIDFSNSKGELIRALPLETPDKMYLIRMPWHTNSNTIEEEVLNKADEGINV